MKSISFPKMFEGQNSTKIKTDMEATLQNIILTLKTEKGTLFGDPYMGIRLKRYIYEQNNYILKDIIIDEIYTQLALFVPQLIFERKDIEIITENSDKAKLYCRFKARNKANYEIETYNLVLYQEDNNAY